MLERGYLEFLTPTGATPIADQLRSAMQRYVGIHLVALGTAARRAGICSVRASTRASCRVAASPSPCQPRSAAF